MSANFSFHSQQLAERYCRRWSIELFYRDIKTTMRMEVMRTKTPAMVEKELLMHTIAYNDIRALILESASTHQQGLGRISFKGAVNLLRQWLPQAAACHEQPRKLARWHEELLEATASVQNPLRSARQEPRAKKRGPKSAATSFLKPLWQRCMETTADAKPNRRCAPALRLMGSRAGGRCCWRRSR